jgi:tetratricopeptide (TPR) repeat protein
MGCLQGLICATLGDWEAGVRHCERTLERGADSLLAGATLCFLGFAYSQGGDSTRAVAALEEGVQAIRALGIRWTEARFLSFLADAHLFKGDVEQARASATRAHALAVETDYAWGVAWAERSLGRALLAAGDLEPAEPHLRAARARFEAVGGRFEVARTSFHLAELLHRAGRAEECRAALSLAREGFRTLGAPLWEARATALERQLAGAPA